MSELPDTPVGLDLHDLDTSIGIVFEGYVITMILYGFIFFEVYSYFERYARDSLGWKATIAIIFCIDSTALAFLTAALHEYMITQFPLIGVSVNAATKDYCVDTGCAVTIIFIVQLCYVFQIWTLGNNRVLVIIILAVATAAFVLGLVATAQMISQPLFNSFSQHPFKTINSCCQGLTMLAATLTFYVLSQSRHHSPKETVFDGVHEYLLSRGGAATILQVGQFITFLAAPSKHYWMIFSLVTKRVFILSILAMLNSRGSVHGHGNLPPGSSSNTARGIELSDMTFAKLTSAKKYQNTLDIRVSRAVEDGNDSEDPEHFEDGVKEPSLTAAAI